MPSVASTCVRSAGPPPVSRYTLLKSPSVQIIDRMVEIDGTANGTMNSTDSALIHQRDWMKKPDSTSATSSFRLIATTRKTIVLMTDRRKIGSSTSFT